jgi:5'-3' exonuclease
MKGLVDVVVTEDSDLLVFGATRVFYKLDRQLNGVEYERAQIQHCNTFDFLYWNENRLIQFCIMCGCDYLDSPKGIGFRRAYKLFSEHQKIEEIMPMIVSKVPEDYLIRFYLAYFSFKYQRVYCPEEKKEVHLRGDEFAKVESDPYEGPIFKKAVEAFGSLDFLGTHHSDSLIQDIAEFRKDPLTKDSYLHSFNKIYDNKKRTKAREGLRKLERLGKNAGKEDQGEINKSISAIGGFGGLLDGEDWLTASEIEDTEEEDAVKEEPQQMGNISQISAIAPVFGQGLGSKPVQFGPFYQGVQAASFFGPLKVAPVLKTTEQPLIFKPLEFGLTPNPKTREPQLIPHNPSTKFANLFSDSTKNGLDVSEIRKPYFGHPPSGSNLGLQFGVNFGPQTQNISQDASMFQLLKRIDPPAQSTSLNRSFFDRFTKPTENRVTPRTVDNQPKPVSTLVAPPRTSIFTSVPTLAPVQHKKEIQICGDFTIFSRQKILPAKKKSQTYQFQDFLMFKLIGGKLFAGGLFVPQRKPGITETPQNSSMDAFRTENFDSFIKWNETK